jgi:hypothetical protein
MVKKDVPGRLPSRFILPLIEMLALVESMFHDVRICFIANVRDEVLELVKVVPGDLSLEREHPAPPVQVLVVEVLSRVGRDCIPRLHFIGKFWFH